MAITRDAFFLAHDVQGAMPSVSYGLFVTNGSAGRATEFVPFTSSGSSTLQWATLRYSTLLGVGSGLYSTDPVTGTVKPLFVPNLAAAPVALVPLGNIAVFTAPDTSGSGAALWRTDGSSAGTYEIVPPGAAASLGPGPDIPINGRVLFQRTSAGGSVGLWSTDGTIAGTVPLLTPSTGVAQFQPIGLVAGVLVFGITSGTNLSSIWATDGTPTGTRQIAAAASIPTLGAIAPNGTLIFGERNVDQLFSSNGAAVIPVTSAPPYGMEGVFSDVIGTPAGVYFVSTQFGPIGGSSATLELTDGTAANTRGVPVPSPAGSTLYNQNPGPALLTPFGNQLLFSDGDAASIDRSAGLWITDGTAAGTTELLAGINPESIAVDANRAFVAAASGLYVTDGTVAGTQLVSSFVPLANSAIVLDPTRVAVTGTHAQYAISPTATGALQIADLVANRDGAGSYAGATVVAFSDGTGVLDPTGNAESLARIYEAAYGRAPDIGGLIPYTEALDGGTATLAQIASAAAASPEFLSDYGSLSDADFVARLYQNADGRAPDAGGLAAYTQALASGQSRGTVLLDIGESYEARQHSVGVAGNANDATVYRLYQAVDGRAPDPGGQDAYSTAIASGQTVQQLAATFLASSEYAATFGTPDNATFVAELYENLLHRAPDAGGLAAYTASLAGGTSRAAVVAAFVTGDEGRLVTAPATHAGWTLTA